MSRILIKGGCILSMDSKTGNHPVADLLIDDGLIAEVGRDLPGRNAEVIDATDSIVMPGFVDAHRHAWQSLFRGLGDVSAESTPQRIGPHYSAEDVYAATLVGLMGAAAAGITTVVDWADIAADQVDAALSAHADTGLRTVLALGGPAGEGDDGWAAGLKRLAEKGPLPLLKLASAPPEPPDGDLDRLAGQWAEAREMGLAIHAHTRNVATDRSVVADLASRDLLGSDVNLVHCSGLDAEDFDTVAASGASVTLTPSSEMTKGWAPPPVQELIDRGIRPGLGIDTETLAPGDMFAPMRAAISLQHATHFDLKLAGKGGLPNLLTTRQVVRFATVDGARAVGLGEVTGSITPGKSADVIVLRADRPNIVPVNDPIGAVVWGMDTSNLDWVFVGGAPLMREGKLQADVARIRTLAVGARDRVAEAVGSVSGVRQ